MDIRRDRKLPRLGSGVFKALTDAASNDLSGSREPRRFASARTKGGARYGKARSGEPCLSEFISIQTNIGSRCGAETAFPNCGMSLVRAFRISTMAEKVSRSRPGKRRCRHRRRRNLHRPDPDRRPRRRQGRASPRRRRPPTTRRIGVVAALAAAGFPIDGIDLIVHGTTTTTNAVLERRLAKTGMITTRGFRDMHRARPPHAAAALWHDRRLRAGHSARSAAGSHRAHRGVRRACARRSTRARLRAAVGDC